MGKMDSDNIQHLVSMGFAADLATEALAAADGNLLQATDWILNHHHRPISPSSSAVQPRIDRFFNFHSKSEIQADDSLTPRRKRQKFPETRENNIPPPLAERMRPRVLDQVVGQDHLLATGSLLRSVISSNRIPSLVFWGPPGTGKTSIAKAIVTSCSSDCYRFVSLSAVTAGVKDVRVAVEEALKSKGKRTVLFIDEVHRFNKAQQDSFLPVIENGSIIFIGATTENPSFHLITPLLSRCRVLTLNPLTPDSLAVVVRRAVSDEERGLAVTFNDGIKQVVKYGVEDDAVEFLSLHSDGDARVALNALEVAAMAAAGRDESGCIAITAADVKEAMQAKHLAYDRAGEEHYNLISALHKSMRGSDPDAAIYWLARMLEGGEEPLYIARRLIRFASEDVGLADPHALTQAVSCYQACHFLGMPECNTALAQCVAYLALAPKSVAVYRAIEAAQKAVRESAGQNERVPLHLRNAPTKLMKKLGYGKGYVYPPDSDEAEPQTYLPPSLHGSKFLHWP